jgi:hypothetical protein
MTARQAEGGDPRARLQAEQEGQYQRDAERLGQERVADRLAHGRRQHEDRDAQERRPPPVPQPAQEEEQQAPATVSDPRVT